MITAKLVKDKSEMLINVLTNLKQVLGKRSLPKDLVQGSYSAAAQERKQT
jgi:hypothetical protein